MEKTKGEPKSSLGILGNFIGCVIAVTMVGWFMVPNHTLMTAVFVAYIIGIIVTIWERLESINHFSDREMFIGKQVDIRVGFFEGLIIGAISPLIAVDRFFRLFKKNKK